MCTIGVIFPGQGSQYVGMLSELSAKFKCILDTFDEASDVLGYDAWDIAQSGPADVLNKTDITQPLMLAADVALYRCIEPYFKQSNNFPSVD